MRRRLIAWAVGGALLPLVGAGTAAASDPPGTQAIGQVAGSAQSAEAEATSTQIRPTNQNIQVSILSSGGNGPVTQNNSSAANAAAGNANTTDQAASQDPSSGSFQAIGQEAGNQQHADAGATSAQIKPTNQNIQVSILSSGSNGPVTQSNTSAAAAGAGNTNATTQHADQTQGGGGASTQPADGCGCRPKVTPDCGCAPSTGGVQAIGQAAYNHQDAEAEANSAQVGPSNTNTPVSIGGSGGNGAVTQSNTSVANAAAGNANTTTQHADQTQAGGGGSSPVQAIGQLAKSWQNADADATSTQLHPSNLNAPVALGSGCGCEKVLGGVSGPVTQSNASAANAAGRNTNDTQQDARQLAGAPLRFAPTAVQAIGQAAFNHQDADADANSGQDQPSNVNAGGGSGAVTQSNSSAAAALSGNKNTTTQSAFQFLGWLPSVL